MTRRTSDDRFVKSVDEAGRGDRSGEDRARDLDASSESTLSMEEYKRLIEDEFKHQILPRMPSLPGWHLCWVPTNSAHDPMHARMRLGYTVVMATEIAGNTEFQSSETSGSYAGAVTCNEMILMKRPERMHQAHMSLFHHDRPNESEAGLVYAAEQNGGRDSNGRSLTTYEGDGYRNMGKAQRAPAHFD